jgi:thymidine phosphorylase
VTSTVEMIRRKRDGGALSGDEIRAVIAGVTDGTVSDYHAAALLMAIYFRGLDGSELAAWTDAMLHSGDVVNLDDVPGIKVDKHSTGGVGDMISLALAPLVAACCPMPRSISSCTATLRARFPTTRCPPCSWPSSSRAWMPGRRRI